MRGKRGTQRGGDCGGGVNERACTGDEMFEGS